MATATSPDPEIDPAHIDPKKHYEVVDGRIVEELPLSAYEYWLATRLVREIILFDPAGKLGNIVEEALFLIDRARKLKRRPDVAFISRERWPLSRAVPRKNSWDVIPDLAIEITSPTDKVDDVLDKLDEYFTAGVCLVWVVHPKHRRIYAYDSPTSVRILQTGDELDGGAVLPNFRLPLASLFETAEDEPTPSA